MSFRQADLWEWQKKNFGDPSFRDLFMGVVEEVGEIAHADLKASQGIRGGVDQDKSQELIVDGLCDVMVFCVQCLSQMGYDACDEYDKVVNEVLVRDWKKNPTGKGYSQHNEP